MRPTILSGPIHLRQAWGVFGPPQPTVALYNALYGLRILQTMK